jgi:APA family basic amino acid/polyamine antiporter
MIQDSAERRKATPSELSRQSLLDNFTSTDTEFKRELGLWDTVMVVIGNTIGSGIFIAPAVIAVTLNSNSGSVVLLVWLVGGLMMFTGALSYSELGALMPRAGGHYVFLKEGFGNMAAFLYGWTIFLVIASGSIAFVAITFVTYLSFFVPMGAVLIKVIAIVTIVILTYVNYIGIKPGSFVLNLFTAFKVIALFALIAVGLILSPPHKENFLPLAGGNTGIDLRFASTFLLALVSALFTYGGWYNVGFVAGEIKNPRRNLPLALLVGTIVVVLIYVLTNYVYANVLSVSAMAGSKFVASDTMVSLLGKAGGGMVSVLVMVSSFGITNAIIMVSPRVYYAMSRDGLFFQALSRVHPTYKTPSVSLILQGVWACVIVMVSETFGQIMNYVVFMDWLFLGLAIYCIFLFRKKYPDAARPYKVWGYPVTPILFILLSAVVVANTLLRAPLESGIGVVIVLSGAPAYFYWKKLVEEKHQPAKTTA